MSNMKNFPSVSRWFLTVDKCVCVGRVEADRDRWAFIYTGYFFSELQISYYCMEKLTNFIIALGVRFISLTTFEMND